VKPAQQDIQQFRRHRPPSGQYVMHVRLRNSQAPRQPALGELSILHPAAGKSDDSRLQQMEIGAHPYFILK
jgi:hypothetical protein